MPTQRKSILVIHPSAQDPAGIRRLLAQMGHVAITVPQAQSALKILGTMRFDVIMTNLSGIEARAARAFIGQLRTLAPGSAVVGINRNAKGAANEPWCADCDALVSEPLSRSRVQWALDFDLRYFGN